MIVKIKKEEPKKKFIEEPLYKKADRAMRVSVYDSVSSAAMTGFTSSYITPFALAMRASTDMIAVLSSLPDLTGNFFQLFSSKIVEIFRNRRAIIVWCSIIQSLFWLPLLLLPHLETKNKIILLIAFVTLHAVFANFQAPVWNSLMGDIVPSNQRGEFFGKRNRGVGLVSFISAVGAGLILSFYKKADNVFFGFSILFIIAFISRIISAYFKSRMYNPPAAIEKSEKFSLLDFIKRMNKTNYGIFVLYVGLFKFAVNIASPFFAVYMLRDLHFGYLQYTFIAAASMIAGFVSLGFWGNFIDNKGTRRVLFIGGMLTPFVPFLWLLTKNYYFLFAVETFSGIAWAGFNLSASNFIFDSVRPENRVRCIAYYNFIAGFLVFLGTITGGFLLRHVDILNVFLISGILRLAVSVLLLYRLKEVRLVEMKIGEETFFKRFLTIRPSEGMVFEVIGKAPKPRKKEFIEEKKKPKFYKRTAIKIQKPDEKELLKKQMLEHLGERHRYKPYKSTETDAKKVEEVSEELREGR